MTRCANATGAGMTALHLLPQSAGFASNVSEVHVKSHKAMKGLKTQNLRDHMSEAELIFTALAELATRQIAESMVATGMNENEVAAKTGGGIAKKARLELEGKTGRKVVSAENYLPPARKKLGKK
jgi:DNA-damage-inducible protein D